MTTIGIFDSGVGGLSVFKEIYKLLPNVNYIYYGDNANCPYGPKGGEFILKRSKEIVELLISKGASIIVIACNTATSYAAEVLRNEYQVPIIGMVPAIKPASLYTNTRTIGVLATYGTLNAPLYQRLKETYGTGINIVEHIGKGFVELVEDGIFYGPKVDRVIKDNIEPMILNNADIIVLGCTHYPFLKYSIEKVANSLAHGHRTISIIDPASAVARHVVSIIEKMQLPTEIKNNTIELLSSGNIEILKSLYEMVKNGNGER